MRRHFKREGDSERGPSYQAEQVRRMALPFVVAAALAGVATPASAATPKVKKPVPAAQLEQAFGVSGMLDENINLSNLRHNGVVYFRMDASWVNAEPNPPIDGEHHYSWESYDKIAARLAANNMKWYPTLDYTPAWASPNGNLFTAPSNPFDFATYTQAFAKRYGPGGDFWTTRPDLPYLPTEHYEIWNEPNSSKFLEDGNPADFYQLYALSRAAIRTVQPNAKVVLGGLLDSGTLDAVGWFNQMARSINKPLSGAVDAVGYHPYLGYESQILSRVKQLRKSIDRHGGKNVPIEITEFDTFAGMESEAGWVKTLHAVASLANSDCKVTRIMPFAAHGDTDGEVNQGGWYTLHNRQGRLTPIGLGYLKSIARTKQQRRLRQHCYPPKKIKKSRKPAVRRPN